MDPTIRSVSSGTLKRERTQTGGNEPTPKRSHAGGKALAEKRVRRLLNQNNLFVSLPADILQYLCREFCSVSDILKMRCVSIDFARLLKQQGFWMEVVRKRLPATSDDEKRKGYLQVFQYNSILARNLRLIGFEKQLTLVDCEREFDETIRHEDINDGPAYCQTKLFNRFLFDSLCGKIYHSKTGTIAHRFEFPNFQYLLQHDAKAKRVYFLTCQEEDPEDKIINVYDSDTFALVDTIEDYTSQGKPILKHEAWKLWSAIPRVAIQSGCAFFVPHLNSIDREVFIVDDLSGKIAYRIQILYSGKEHDYEHEPVSLVDPQKGIRVFKEKVAIQHHDDAITLFDFSTTDCCREMKVTEGSQIVGFEIHEEVLFVLSCQTIDEEQKAYRLMAHPWKNIDSPVLVRTWNQIDEPAIRLIENMLIIAYDFSISEEEDVLAMEMLHIGTNVWSKLTLEMPETEYEDWFCPSKMLISSGLILMPFDLERRLSGFGIYSLVTGHLYKYIPHQMAVVGEDHTGVVPVASNMYDFFEGKISVVIPALNPDVNPTYRIKLYDLNSDDSNF